MHQQDKIYYIKSVMFMIRRFLVEKSFKNRPKKKKMY